MLTPYSEDTSQESCTNRYRFAEKTIEKRNVDDYLKKMNPFIVMSGSAKRKPIQPKMAERQIMRSPNSQRVSTLKPEYQFPTCLRTMSNKFSRKIWCEEEFFKLRAPHRVTRSNIRNSTKIPASKSCKVLFDYLKFYNSGMTGSKDKSHRCSMEVDLDKKFENQTKSNRSINTLRDLDNSAHLNQFISGCDFISRVECNRKSENEGFSFLNLTFARRTEVIPFEKQVNFNFFSGTGGDGRTMTSADFMKNAFPD